MLDLAAPHRRTTLEFAMSVGLEISCPGLVSLVSTMARTDPYDVYALAAGSAASVYEQHLANNARLAGAPKDVVAGISSYTHDSGLVMVGPSRDTAEAADAHEYGDQFNAPGGWGRQTQSEHGPDARQHFRQALNAQLDIALTGSHTPARGVGYQPLRQGPAAPPPEAPTFDPDKPPVNLTEWDL